MTNPEAAQDGTAEKDVGFTGRSELSTSAAQPEPANSNKVDPAPRPDPDHEEYQYLDLIGRIMREGERRPDRTGTGTLSIFGPPQLRFSLSKPCDNNNNNNDDDDDDDDDNTSSEYSYTPILPLLTTKRVFIRAVITELLWFLSGSTSSLPLSEAGIHIWDGNGSREYLDGLGFEGRAVGDLGPVYGFQWRHSGAEYRGSSADYTGEGVDQIGEIVRLLREEPFSRRICLSGWNVADLKSMALPPCHVFAQFYVSFPDPDRTAGSAKAKAKAKKGHLTCILYQRSCDMGLGVPFNIASYALLTHMLAHAADLVPSALIHTMGDAHVYVDHLDPLRQQLDRVPSPEGFPALNIRRSDRGRGVVDGWAVADFEVVGYRPMGGLSMKLSV